MSWLVQSISVQGAPAQVLVNDQFRGAEPKERLPRVARFAVKGRRATSGSYWHPEETKVLDEIEDYLLELVSGLGKEESAYVGRISTGGIRGHVVYFACGLDIHGVHDAARARYPEYNVGLDEEEDREWTWYAQMLRMAKSAGH